MIELFSQLRDLCPVCKAKIGPYYLPHTDDDMEKAKGHKLFQIVRMRVFGIKHPRSLAQLNLYFAGCKFIADSSDNRQWNTKNRVDFQCRVGAHLVDPDLVVVKRDGSVHFSYLSIAFKNMAHLTACHYFDQAWGIMTDFWNATKKEKITSDELVEMVKQSMKGE